MRAWIIASLVVLLAVPSIALAQGPPSLEQSPEVTRAEVARQLAQHPLDPARRAAVLAEREAIIRSRYPGAHIPDARTTPKPPDEISPQLRDELARLPHPQPQGPPPATPPRRSEEPTDRLLRLLSLNSAPTNQNAVTCGAAVQSDLPPNATVQFVRGVMFCHAPDSFFTSQSMVGMHTTWLCNPGCSEVLINQVYGMSCARWGYDWQVWYCPQDTSYLVDDLVCGQWSRALMPHWGVSPGSAQPYTNTVTTPWRLGCPYF